MENYDSSQFFLYSTYECVILFAFWKVRMEVAIHPSVLSTFVREMMVATTISCFHLLGPTRKLWSTSQSIFDLMLTDGIAWMSLGEEIFQHMV